MWISCFILVFWGIFRSFVDFFVSVFYFYNARKIYDSIKNASCIYYKKRKIIENCFLSLLYVLNSGYCWKKSSDKFQLSSFIFVKIFLNETKKSKKTQCDFFYLIFAWCLKHEYIMSHIGTPIDSLIIVLWSPVWLFSFWLAWKIVKKTIFKSEQKFISEFLFLSVFLHVSRLYWFWGWTFEFLFFIFSNFNPTHPPMIKFSFYSMIKLIGNSRSCIDLLYNWDLQQKIFSE